MVNMSNVEQLVDKYVSCWLPQRPNYSGIYEDNSFGCEHIQILRNGFTLESFSHDELSRLATLLTRELRGQINRDHKFFWAWCAFLVYYFHDSVTIFKDHDFTSGFTDLVNVLLASRRRFPAGPVYLRYLQQALGFVNNHLLATELSKWNVAGPLTFSIIEGLLRRKNGFYVNTDGSVKRTFSISHPTMGTKTFSLSGPPSGRFLNRINHSLYCFEQNVVVSRGRPSPHLKQMQTEIIALYPTISNVNDAIDDWRNDLIHGKAYWQNLVPILVNLICLLLIDEIDPSVYDGKRTDIIARIKWHSRWYTLARAPWDLYPPDL